MGVDGKVMVIGASGRVGFRVCQRLRDQGVDVMGAARFSDPETRRALDDIGVETHVYEVKTGDPDVLPEADLVILEVWDPRRHNDPNAHDEIWDLNYAGVGRIVARYVERAGIVNGCSGNVYGSSAHAWRETDPPRPDIEYGLARFAQEKLIDFLADRAGTRAVHLRYFHANTPDAGFIHRMATKILNRESLGEDPDACVRVIGMDDFVRCTVDAAARLDQMPQAVNIVHPTCWTHRSLAERIVDALGEGKVIFNRDTGGAERSVHGDPALMLETFGPPRQDLDTLIDRVCQHVREHA